MCCNPININALNKSDDVIFKALCGHVFHSECAGIICNDEPINKIMCPTCHVPWLSEEDKNAVGLTHEKFFDMIPDYDSYDEYQSDDEEHIQRIDNLRSLLRDRIYPIGALERKESERRAEAKRIKIAELDAINPSRVLRRQQIMRAQSYNMLRILGGLGGLEWNNITKDDEYNFYDDGKHYTFINDSWVLVN